MGGLRSLGLCLGEDVGGAELGGDGRCRDGRQMRGIEEEAHGEAKLGCIVGRTEGKGGVQSWGHVEAELGGKRFVLCVSGLGGPEGLGWSVGVSVSFQLLLLSPSALCCGAVIGSGMLGVTGCQWGSLGTTWVLFGVIECPGCQ